MSDDNKSSFSSKIFALGENFVSNNESLLTIFSSEKEAYQAFTEAKFFFPDSDIHYLPDWDCLPYDRLGPSIKVSAERAKIISQLKQDLKLGSASKKKWLILAPSTLLRKIPDFRDFSSLKLSINDNLKQSLVEDFLMTNGYMKSAVAYDIGEFSARGDILDIVTSDGAFRLNFAWDIIESIKLFDNITQISVSTINSTEIFPLSELLLNQDNKNIFKEKFLLKFGVNFINEVAYQDTLDGLRHQGIEHLLPLFYESMISITDLLTNPKVIFCYSARAEIINFFHEAGQQYSARLLKDTFSAKYFAINPSEIWLNPEDIMGAKEFNLDCSHLEILSLIYDSNIKKVTAFDLFKELIFDSADKTVIVAASSDFSKARLLHMMEIYSVENTNIISQIGQAKIGLTNIVIQKITNSFISDKYIFISDYDLTGKKLTDSQPAHKKLKNILTEAASFVAGELVVHKDHGVGRFEAVENLTVLGRRHDFIKIIYANNDILFVPVENIDLIAKYGSDFCELDKLGSLNWQKRKAKAKDKINLIAGSLMQIAAERAVLSPEPIEFNQLVYDAFCAKFPYVETQDQQRAIDEILDDFNSTKSMDRLICGDVGFGKTEVAMRAAFVVAVSKSAQVAVIAPTTILARQHYVNFLERFKGFDINIKHLSRLITSRERIEIKKMIKSGEASIIIGTHALLSEDIDFFNLRLLIIDEEQHFGVKQKEKLKSLKFNKNNPLHVLSLSATPIPRTLQMSLLGIKDLSLITTPPIDRLPVKTIVIPFDAVIIRDALMKEHYRGGRSFYVSPRIADLEDIEKKLKIIVPELKYVIAHGQMTPAILDKIMNDYYEGKFDILLSTTIIESGIDIKNANTMIVHKPDLLGLAQLHQLRGRVGRGKDRGYFYLTLDPKIRASDDVLKRMQILQDMDRLGGGFTIATHDMDNRGFGNLIGSEQSGNIKEVGIELYQDMLKEAVEKINKGESNKSSNLSPLINLGLSIYIPAEYIADDATRMGIYRRMGDLNSSEDLKLFIEEMRDRFGEVPPEMANLIEIIKIKNLCKQLKIAKFELGELAYSIKFDNNQEINHEDIIRFVNKYPRNVKIKPENKLIISWNKHNDVVENSLSLLSELERVSK